MRLPTIVQRDFMRALDLNLTCLDHGPGDWGVWADFAFLCGRLSTVRQLQRRTVSFLLY